MRKKPRTDGEPTHSIFDSDGYLAARPRAERLPLEQGEPFLRLLDYLEAGWSIVRPMQLAAERYFNPPAPEGTAPAEVAGFIDVEVTEEYRGLCLDCAEAVPRVKPGEGGGDFPDATGFAEEIERKLSVLNMATAHPAFPDDLRVPVREAHARFREWREGLHTVLGPVLVLTDDD